MRLEGRADDGRGRGGAPAPQPSLPPRPVHHVLKHPPSPPLAAAHVRMRALTEDRRPPYAAPQQTRWARERRHIPTPVRGLDAAFVSAVAAGWRHSLVVTDGLRLFSWGWGGWRGARGL